MTARQEKPRYFYRDPHHALSMSIDHGMELLVEHHASKELISANPEWLAMHIYGKLSGEPVKDVRLFVAPQSLHLLEPRYGDVMFLLDGDMKKVGFNLAMPQDAAFLSPGIVIQRNGLAFMWPESESEAA